MNLKRNKKYTQQLQTTSSDYMHNKICQYEYKELTAETPPHHLPLLQNHLLFIIEGTISIIHKKSPLKINAEKIVFITQNTDTIINTDTTCKILICSFKICPLSRFESCQKSNGISPEGIIQIPLKAAMKDFSKNFISYFLDNIDCEYLYATKLKEMFFIFKWYYSEKEVEPLFSNTISPPTEFQHFIYSHYDKTGLNVSKLARLTGMSRTRFDIKFKEEFGISAHKWMLKQIGIQILQAAKEPGISINSLMDKFGFVTPSSFTRFCKQQCGCTPKELIAKK